MRRRYILKTTHTQTAPVIAPGGGERHEPPDQNPPQGARPVQEEDDARAVDGGEAESGGGAAGGCLAAAGAAAAGADPALLLGGLCEERLGVRVEQDAGGRERGMYVMFGEVDARMVIFKLSQQPPRHPAHQIKLHVHTCVYAPVHRRAAPEPQLAAGLAVLGPDAHTDVHGGRRGGGVVDDLPLLAPLVAPCLLTAVHQARIDGRGVEKEGTRRSHAWNLTLGAT